jgi:hypothetical protein
MIRGTSTPSNRRIWRAVCMLSAFLAMLVALPAPAGANHTDPQATAPEGVVCGFIADLDVLLDEFGLVVGGFDDDRLNRALTKAGQEVLAARESAEEPELVASLRSFRAAMRELEKGAAVPVSGNGFADDIASFGSFMAQLLVEDLINVTMEQRTVSADILIQATRYLESGKALRASGVEEWERAVADFLSAIRLLDRDLSIGSPCS